MTDNAHREAFAKWLQSATNVELDRVKTGLQAATASAETDADLQALQAEINKREMRVFESRAEFFPRVTFRNMEDAELTGELLKGYALQMMEAMQHLRATNHMHSLGLLSATYVTPDGKEREPAEVLADYSVRCLRAADLLAAVQAEMSRLREGVGTEADKEYSDKFTAIVEQLHNESEGN